MKHGKPVSLITEAAIKKDLLDTQLWFIWVDMTVKLMTAEASVVEKMIKELRHLEAQLFDVA